MTRDHLSMVLTSDRFGIFNLSLEERLRSRQLARLRMALLSSEWWLKPSRGTMGFLNWTPELSKDMTEFRESLTLLPTSEGITSLFISSVVRRMFPYGSTCAGRADARESAGAEAWASGPQKPRNNQTYLRPSLPFPKQHVGMIWNVNSGMQQKYLTSSTGSYSAGCPTADMMSKYMYPNFSLFFEIQISSLCK